MILSGRQIQILIQLREGSWTTKELADFLGMFESNVTREIRELKRSGHIQLKSKKKADDLRKNHHQIDQIGRNYLNQKYGK